VNDYDSGQVESQPINRNSAIRWLMLVILAWGLLLALGTFLFGGNKPLVRALIVAGCTLGFLALWNVALAVRKRA
jgi:high-affinity Fe2+/Pb2+ permease